LNVAAENRGIDSTPSVGNTGGVGSLLRETRQKLGCDLPTVATSLRIRQPYLQAIEDGRFEDLPGATYAVGFVRGYAEYLSLDSEEIVRRFKQENAEFANRHELVFPSAVTEGSIPTGALLLFGIVAAALAYGAWYWYQGRQTSIAEAVPQLPERLAALIHRPMGSGSEVVAVPPADGAKPDAAAPAEAPPAPATAAAPAPNLTPGPTVPGLSSAPAAAPSSISQDVVPPAEDDSPIGTAPTITAQPAVPAAPPPAPTPAAPSADQPPAGPAAGRVALQAIEDCWVQIRDASGQVIHSRLLHKGDTFAVPDQPGLLLTAGNAAALTLLLDGKPTRALGRGKVRRNLSLDPETLGKPMTVAKPKPEATKAESSQPGAEPPPAVPAGAE
jgi:cytoskeleton protein RodZ